MMNHHESSWWCIMIMVIHHGDSPRWFIMITHHDEPSLWITMINDRLHHHDESLWFLVMNHDDSSPWVMICVIMMNRGGSSWWITVIHHYEAPRGPEKIPFREYHDPFAMGAMIVLQGIFFPWLPLCHASHSVVHAFLPWPPWHVFHAEIFENGIVQQLSDNTQNS